MLHSGLSDVADAVTVLGEDGATCFYKTLTRDGAIWVFQDAIAGDNRAPRKHSQLLFPVLI